MLHTSLAEHSQCLRSVIFPKALDRPLPFQFFLSDGLIPPFLSELIFQLMAQHHPNWHDQPRLAPWHLIHQQTHTYTHTLISICFPSFASLSLLPYTPYFLPCTLLLSSPLSHHDCSLIWLTSYLCCLLWCFGVRGKLEDYPYLSLVAPGKGCLNQASVALMHTSKYVHTACCICFHAVVFILFSQWDSAVITPSLPPIFAPCHSQH